MNRKEAEFILSALRAGEEDLPNQEIAAAIQLAESNEALGKWFAEIRGFDSEMRDRLRDIPVPPDLKASILTGIKISQKPAWSRRIMIGTLAAAASLAIGLALWNVVDLSPTQIVNEFQRDMLKEIEELASIDYMSSDPDQVVDYFKSRDLLLDFDIPQRIDGAKLAGCKIVEWKGHRISLICFSLPGEKGMPKVHLITMAADPIHQLRDGEEHRMKVNGWSSTVWRSGDKVHLLAMKNDEERNLRELVPFG